MLKFFRKIRQQQLSQNQFSKYLFYALGEILLVVIGILIALQINNWNEEQKNRSKEQQYLAALKLEIATNINRLNQEIERNDNHIKAAKAIATMIALNNQPKDETAFSSQLRKVFVDDAVFTPKNTIINEIESTGSLKLIQNKLLREFIADWRSTLIKLKEHEKGALDFKHTCAEVFQNNGNIKVIFDWAYGILSPSKRTFWK